MFRVDDPDAGSGDDEVVDVRARTGNAAVVEHHDVLGGDRIEGSPDLSLANRAGLPRDGALRSPESAAAIVPMRPSPHVSRIFASSLACRRSYSRLAEAPAVLVSFVPMVSIQSGRWRTRRAPVRGALARSGSRAAWSTGSVRCRRCHCPLTSPAAGRTVHLRRHGAAVLHRLGRGPRRFAASRRTPAARPASVRSTRSRRSRVP